MIPDDRDDPEYWDALADRIASAAARRARANGFEWLVQSHGAWVTTLMLAAAALAFMLISETGSVDRTPRSWSDVVAPTEEIGKTMTHDRPPAIGALLLEPATEGQR